MMRYPMVWWCVVMSCLSASATTVTTTLSGPPETTCTATPRPVSECWPDADGYSPSQVIPLPVRSAKRGQINTEYVRVEVPHTSEAVIIEIIPTDQTIRSQSHE